MVAALRGPDGKQWLAALHKEVRSHAKHNTLGPKLSQAPPGFITVPFAALPQVKRNGIKKARGVMRGYLMMQGQHFNETFAPVPIVDTIRLLLAIATAKDWQIKQGDINTAFLCSEMDHKVYARVPDWFDEATTLENIPTTTSIREVLKGIPGMPQCSRLFNNKAKATFKALGLSQSKADPALFFNTQLSIYLVAWVDDLFLFFPTSSTESATTLWKNLQAAFDLGPWDDINDCLGCVVHRDRERRCMHIEQSKAISALADRSGLSQSKPMTTPMTPGLKLTKEDCPQATQERIALTGEQKWYRSAVASCIYFSTWTRPDIAYAVSRLCRYMHNPGKQHIVALKHLIRYLAATPTLGLFYKDLGGKKEKVFGYYDAAHADCPDTMRSTLGDIFYYGNYSPIGWSSKVHSFVTTSSNHSEYCAAAKTTRRAMALHYLCDEIGFNDLIKPIALFSDSKGAIAMAYNPVAKTKCKHVDLADHYTREKVESGATTISYVPTGEMRADAMTKPLGHTLFLKHRPFLVGDSHGN